MKVMSSCEYWVRLLKVKNTLVQFFGAVVVKADATHLSEKEKVILTDYALPRGGKKR